MNIFKLSIIAVFCSVMLFSSCENLFDDVYDSADPNGTISKEYGFITVNDADSSGTIYINASSYTRWTYLNLHNHTIDTIDIDKKDSEPSDWDFAVHRYDAKTNNASVLETNYTSIKSLRSSRKIPMGTYVSDSLTTTKIIIDMSHMMEGILSYDSTYYNLELSKWLNVNTSTMPPTYFLSGKVYVVRLKDGTRALLFLHNFMNNLGVKGYMTIDYIYPYEI